MGLRTRNWECIEGSPNWRIKSHMSMSKHSFLKHRVARLHLVCFPHSNLHYLHQWNSCSRRNKKTGMKLVNHHHLLHRWPVTGDQVKPMHHFIEETHGLNTPLPFSLCLLLFGFVNGVWQTISNHRFCVCLARGNKKEDASRYRREERRQLLSDTDI